jgi:hypothetical protein
MKMEFLYLFISFLGTIGNTQAKPLSYTFEGYISELWDTAGAIQAAGITNGDKVRYTLLVDLDKQASLARNSGVVLTHSDRSTIGLFYADLVSGSLIEEIGGGRFNGPLDYAEYNFGNSTTANVWTAIQVGSDNNWILAYAYRIFSKWTVGTLVNGVDVDYSQTKSSAYHAELTLTSISKASSFPDPSSLFLLGCGPACIMYIQNISFLSQPG